MSGPLQAYVRDPNPTTFAGVVEAYQTCVLDAAHFVLRDMASAEDATQDVFLGLLRRPPRLDAVRNERAFLARCAIRKALDGRKLAMRRRRYEMEAGRPEAQMPHDEEAPALDQLRAAVRRLPEKLGLAIHLHFFQGFAMEEVAAALGCHRNTATRRIARAKKLLRAELSSDALALLALPGGARSLRPGVTPSTRLRARLARLPFEVPAIGAAAAAAAVRAIPLSAILWATAGGALLITAIVAIGHFLFTPSVPTQDSAAKPAPSVTSPHPSESGSAPDPNSGPAAPEAVEPEEVPPGQIRGRVIRTDDSAPIAGARVSAFASRKEITFSPHDEALPEYQSAILTDEQGRFAFIDLPLLPPPDTERELYLKAIAAGWSAASTFLRVWQDRPGKEVVFRLARGRALRGRAILEGGSPVGEGFVLLSMILPGCSPPEIPLQDHTCPRADFAPDGTFAFPCGFKDGEYVLEARSQGLRPILIDPFEIEGVEPEEILLTFARGLRIRGRLVDLSGRSAAQLIVRARLYGYECLSASVTHWDLPPVETLSDAEGELVLEGLWPGAYVIEVPGTDREGRTSHVDVRIDGIAPELTQDLEIVVPRLVRIRGRATGPDGSPVVEEILDFAGYQPRDPMGGKSLSAKVRTDRDGRYLERIREGEWKFMALRADGTTTGWRDLNLLELDAAASPLDLAFAVRGILRVRALDPDGHPVPGASIRITANSSKFEWTRTNAADHDGFTSFQTCPPEPHHETWWQVCAASDDLCGEGFWSGAQGPESEITIVMKRIDRPRSSTALASAVPTVSPTDANEFDAIVPQFVSVRGRVIGEEGQPIRLAIVSVIPADQPAADYWTRQRNINSDMYRRGTPPLKYSQRLASVYTDRKGAFRLEAPAGEALRLCAWAPGYLTAVGEIEQFESGAAQERTIVLRSGAEVRGQLLYWNGEPAAYVRQNDGAFVTDSEGRFAFGGYEPGQQVYFPLEWLPGSPHIHLKLVAGGPEQVIRAPREAVIRGRVLGPDGRAARCLRLDHDRASYWEGEDFQDGMYGFAPRILSDGRFEIRRLAPGKRRMIVLAEGAAPKRIEGIDLSEGEEVDLEIRLSEGGTIRCRVAQAPPALPERVSAGFQPSLRSQWGDEGMFRQILLLEPDGSIVFPHAAPGTGTFWVRFGDLGTVLVEDVEVREGEFTEIEAPFRPAGSRADPNE